MKINATNTCSLLLILSMVLCGCLAGAGITLNIYKIVYDSKYTQTTCKLTAIEQILNNTAVVVSINTPIRAMMIADTDGNNYRKMFIGNTTIRCCIVDGVLSFWCPDYTWLYYIVIVSSVISLFASITPMLLWVIRYTNK